MDIRTEVKKMKADSPIMAGLSQEVRNKALLGAAEALLDNKEKIFQANREDMEQAEQAGLGQAVLKRLKFDEHKLEDVIKGADVFIGVSSPGVVTQEMVKNPVEMEQIIANKFLIYKLAWLQQNLILMLC